MFCKYSPSPYIISSWINSLALAIVTLANNEAKKIGLM